MAAQVQNVISETCGCGAAFNYSGSSISTAFAAAADWRAHHQHEPPPPVTNITNIADRQELDAVNHELRDAGIEYPLGHRGVHDLASMLDGLREDSALWKTHSEVLNRIGWRLARMTGRIIERDDLITEKVDADPEDMLAEVMTTMGIDRVHLDNVARLADTIEGEITPFLGADENVVRRIRRALGQSV